MDTNHKCSNSTGSLRPSSQYTTKLGLWILITRAIKAGSRLKRKPTCLLILQDHQKPRFSNGMKKKVFSTMFIPIKLCLSLITKMNKVISVESTIIMEVQVKNGN